MKTTKRTIRILNLPVEVTESRDGIQRHQLLKVEGKEIGWLSSARWNDFVYAGSARNGEAFETKMYRERYGRTKEQCFTALRRELVSRYLNP